MNGFIVGLVFRYWISAATAAITFGLSFLNENLHKNYSFYIITLQVITQY